MARTFWITKAPGGEYNLYDFRRGKPDVSEFYFAAGGYLVTRVCREWAIKVFGKSNLPEAGEVGRIRIGVIDNGQA